MQAAARNVVVPCNPTVIYLRNSAIVQLPPPHASWRLRRTRHARAAWRSACGRTEAAPGAFPVRPSAAALAPVFYLGSTRRRCSLPFPVRDPGSALVRKTKTYYYCSVLYYFCCLFFCSFAFTLRHKPLTLTTSPPYFLNSTKCSCVFVFSCVV